MRVQRAGPQSRLNGSQTPIWKRLGLKMSFPRRQQRLGRLVFAAGHRFASPGNPPFLRRNDPARFLFSPQPFKWLDPRLPFCKNPRSPELLGPRQATRGPSPAGMAASQGCAGGCGRAQGAVGDRLRRLIHKSPLTFHVSIHD